MKNLIQVVALGAILSLHIAPSVAQIHLGVDIASRYVWRGTDFGDSPSIQPTLYYDYDKSHKFSFDGGVWVAYPFSSQSADVTGQCY